MPDVAARLAAVRDRIREAEQTHGRQPGSVELLAVSKRQPLDAMQTAYEAGQRAFGENYLQEGVDKCQAMTATDIEWHFIGALQSNKTRPAAEGFDWVHAVDRLKIARRLSEQRPETLGALQCCIQVNVSGEASKAGVSPQALPELAHAVAELPRLRLRGLMTLPEAVTGFEAQRAAFSQLRQLQEALIDDGLALDTLSMGMSNDLEAAIAEGATLVRLGTAVFGPRPEKTP
ncbi:YggS family pyridoxal phosphate-dependent enzyme [Spiribacter sp. 2438]|uniref:YggS family pyridoxal phosphate-dependent enzyme n=1 Tax=Spiribacter sp. 2438 TaxID=2666185 RepID=UPI0012AF7BAE|nr:YggS family pyridoxal phosphate-dependent enzyme [Spiribacter sp. 2438]QGM22487.1 YggS family pyridoxal phosphate-dependent enzyme [Spiribacter sp. 2438]